MASVSREESWARAKDDSALEAVAEWNDGLHQGD